MAYFARLTLTASKMNCHYTCQAILVAYHLVSDREVVDLLRPTITIADTANTPNLDYFQMAAFKLQSIGALVYFGHSKERTITTKGRRLAQQVLGTLRERFGVDLDDKTLITRLAPDCLKELNEWLAQGRAAEELREKIRNGKH